MNIQWYPGQLEALDDDVRKSLAMTAEAVRTDIIAQRTMPYAQDPNWTKTNADGTVERSMNWGNKDIVPGQLQGSMFVDRTFDFDGRVSLVSNTPYARRLYYHPEYNFYRGHNPKAGGLWYEPYISGKRRSWMVRAFEAFMRKLRG